MWEWLRKLICAIVLGGLKPKDITVVEDSTNDNGYLTGKAKKNPRAIRAKSKEDMVKKIRTELGFCGCIRVLKIVGHGSPGNISVGDGQGWERCKHINGNRDEWEKPLSKLKGRFCKAGRILLVGCNVGACEKGRSKLSELAGFFGVPVEAPTGKTYGDCSEEAGSEHVVAVPGEGKPPHKESPSDKKKKEAEPGGEQRIPFDVGTVRRVGVHPAQLVRGRFPLDAAAHVLGDERSIREFFDRIDFSHTVNGEGLGADYNAHVLIDIAGEVVEYRICADFDYLLAVGDWRNMYEITWDLKRELRDRMDGIVSAELG